MANYAALKAAIEAAIYENHKNEITGDMLQEALLAMVNSLGAGYQYKGVATPATNPGIPDYNVFYLASEAGTYSNFGGLAIGDNEVAALVYNGSWSKQTTGAATASQVSQLAQEVDEKVDVSLGVNLVNPALFITGKGISVSAGDGSLGNVASCRVSGYIPVNGQNIISNGLFSAYWCGAIYDASYNFLRLLRTAQYTYQSGDAYIRLTFGASSVGEERANYGTTLSQYEAFNPIGGYLTGVQTKMDNLEARVDELLFSPCLTKAVNGDESTQELAVISAVKAIQIIGPVNKTDNFAVRLISRNTSSGYRIMLAKVNSTGTEVPTFLDFNPVNFTENGLATLSVTNPKGITLNAIIDYSGIPVGSNINLFGLTFHWWIKSENIIPTSSAPSTSDNNPISSKAVAEALQAAGAESSSPIVEVAKGMCASDGTYESELAALPINNNDADYNVGFDTVAPKSPAPLRKNIIIFNHDDGAMPDLVATRKIYNKYGFTGSFCMMLSPFASLNDAKAHIRAGKKLLSDGHEMGLHALFGISYWDTDRHFDVGPDGGSIFAPTLQEIRGENPDGTGTNSFGATITSGTKIGDIYYHAGIYDVGLWNTLVINLTQAQLNTINSAYTWYGDAYQVTGIDDLALDDIMNAASASSLTKTRLQWLEYWYNGLIDSNLGYSSTANTIAEKFAEDYDVPSGASAIDYYPDAAHILSGKMVYYADTSNPNYNDPTYQKVGRFTKGLFKGCFSTCNWEVMARAIDVMQVFFRKYYGTDHFTDQHRHGVGYVDFTYEDSSGIRYLNREKTIPADKNGLFFVTNIGAFTSKSNILAGFRCDAIKEPEYRSHMRLNGQLGNYYGVGTIKSPWNYGGYDNYSDYSGYLAMFGVGAIGMETMSYDTFMTFMENVPDWLKFCYNNAGQAVTRNGLTMNVYSYIKSILSGVFAAKGTGKIPLVTVDSLLRSPAIIMAVDILFRAFKKNGFEVVSFGKGLDKILSEPRNTGGNLFPNFGFEQGLMKLVGSSDSQSKMPDGWKMLSAPSTLNINTESINSESAQVLTFESGSLYTLIYGLPGGSYQMKFWAKSSGGSVDVFLKKNGEIIGTDSAAISTTTPTSAWVEYAIDIEIPEPYQKVVDTSDAVSVICDGCEDNVFAVKVLATANSGKFVSIAQPRLYKK